MNAQSKTGRHVLIYCVLAIYLQGSLVLANLGQTLYLNESAVPATPDLGLQLGVATDDHGNSPEEATFIPTISRFAGAWQTEGDVDCFKIPVPVDGVLTVTVLSNAVTELSVQNQNYQEVAWAASGGSLNELSVAEYLTAGTYYIQVAEMVHTQGTAYGIKTEFNPAEGKVHLLPITIYSSPQGEDGAVSRLGDNAIAVQDVYDVMVDLIDPESFLMTGAFVIPETFLINPDVLQGQLDEMMQNLGDFVDGAICDGFPWLDILIFVWENREELGTAIGEGLGWLHDELFGEESRPEDYPPDLDDPWGKCYGDDQGTKEKEPGTCEDPGQGTEEEEESGQGTEEDEEDEEDEHWPAPETGPGGDDGEEWPGPPMDPVITVAIDVDDFVNDVLDTQSWLMGDAMGPADSFMGNPDIVQAELDRLMGMVIAALSEASVGSGSVSYNGEGAAHSGNAWLHEEAAGAIDGFGAEGSVHYRVVPGSCGTITGQTDTAGPSSVNEIQLGIQEDCGAAGAPLSVTVQTPMDDNAYTQPESGSYLLRP